VPGTVEERNAFVKSVQFHKVSGRIIHVDLYEPDPNKHMRFKIPVEFVGEAVGSLHLSCLQRFGMSTLKSYMLMMKSCSSYSVGRAFGFMLQ
jgi:hypothetical protein